MLSEDPLFSAVCNGDVQTVTNALVAPSGSVCINLEEHHGADEDTLLTKAVRLGHVDITKLLLSAGAAIEGRDNSATQRKTPLLWAVKSGHVELVELLLNNGADIKARSTDQEYMALQIAAHEGHSAVVELLLDRGVDIWEHRNTMAFEIAARRGHAAVVEVLAKREDVKLDYREGRSARQAAVGREALMVAASAGHVAVVEILILLNHGVRITIERYHPLHAAAEKGHAAVVELFMNRSNCINFKDRWSRRTVLHIAAISGHVSVVNLVLDRGIKISAKDSSGLTPLHLAVRYGHTAVVELLLNRGADWKGKDKEGRTALFVAARAGYTAIVKLLLDHGARVGTMSREAIRVSNNSESRSYAKGLFIERIIPGQSLSLNRPTSDGTKRYVPDGTNIRYGETLPLHIAATRGHRAVLELLLGRKADTAAKGGLGRTALHMAAFSGQQRAVEVLLAWGADGTAKDNYEKTAIDLAEKDGHKEIAAIIRLRIEPAWQRVRNFVLFLHIGGFSSADWSVRRAFSESSGVGSMTSTVDSVELSSTTSMIRVPGRIASRRESRVLDNRDLCTIIASFIPDGNKTPLHAPRTSGLVKKISRIPR